MKTAKKANKSRKTDAQLAAEIGCSERSIRNYRQQGGPVDDVPALRRWLADRRSVPPGMPDPAPTQAKAPTSSIKSTAKDTGEGAPAALGRLAAEERRLFAAMQACDPKDARTIRKGWLDVVEALRKTDVSVGEKRAGDQVGIPQVIAVFDRALEALTMTAGGLSASVGFVLEGMSRDPENTRYVIGDEQKRLMTACNHVRTRFVSGLNESAPVDGRRMVDIVFNRLNAMGEAMGEGLADLRDVIKAGGAVTAEMIDGVTSRIMTRLESLTVDRKSND